MDDTGHECPLAFASSKLSDTQTRWSILEKDAYAVVFALQKFDHIIFASNVAVFFGSRFSSIYYKWKSQAYEG